jgi:hypothetical protein
LDKVPRTLQSLALFCKVANNAQSACHAVGLSLHPAIAEHQRAVMHRHPIFAKVIYHADSWTLYSAGVPELDFNDGDDDPGVLVGGDGVVGAAHPLQDAPVDGALAPDGAGGANSQHCDGPSAAGRGGGQVQHGVDEGPGDDAGGDSSAGSGGGSGSGSIKARLIMTLHNGAHDLLHKYLVQFIQLCIGEHKGSYFSVPLHPQALATVKARMQPHLQAPADLGEDISLATSSRLGLHINSDVVQQAPLFCAMLQRNLFCKVVRKAPSKLIHHHIRGEEGFGSTDSIVSLHEALKVDPTNEFVLLDTTSTGYHTSLTKQSIVLSFKSFPLHCLLEMRVWIVSDGIHCQLSPQFGALSMPVECQDVLPEVLRDLLASHSGDGVAVMASDSAFEQKHRIGGYQMWWAFREAFSVQHLFMVVFVKRAFAFMFEDVPPRRG